MACLASRFGKDLQPGRLVDAAPISFERIRLHLRAGHERGKAAPANSDDFPYVSVRVAGRFDVQALRGRHNY